jgi:HAD superfamily hydrolase (TIGR01490 family)
MRLAIFDLCDTLVNFQSANEFCKYVLKKESRNSLLNADCFFDKFYFYRLFGKLGLSHFSQKKVLLRGLRGLTKAKLELYGKQYVHDVIENQLNREVFQKFLEHKEQGDIVVINSGGYEAYLQHFSDKYNIEYTFSTRFKYVNNIFSGEIEGIDCLGQEKVARMKEVDILDKGYKEIFVYSDSITDMPIFNLANQRIAVIKGNMTPNWCQSNFEIIKV